MTGLTAAHHGVVMNYDTWLEAPTLPGLLARADYQTHLVGKLHLWPHRKLYGFDSADWSDGPQHCDGTDDYARFLRRDGVDGPGAAMAGGQDINGWVARPWHMAERLHFSNWCADKALEFLQRRDPTRPFFLNVGFLHPHQPCTPPQAHWDRYMAMALPEPLVGDWARVFDGPQRGLPTASWRTALEPAVMRQYRAGYYGAINHIDDQIGRILQALPRNMIVVFVADHGEMLGDHEWIRKRNAFEPSARIPFLLRFPDALHVPQRVVRDEAVELMNVMPTLLDAVGIAPPEGLDGRSVMSLLRGETTAWREYVHGECAVVPSLDSGMQYLTDGRRKHIWYPGPGTEQYFDLVRDPREMADLARTPAYVDEIACWRTRLIAQLAGRPEGFTDGSRLLRLGNPTPLCLPHCRRPDTPSRIHRMRLPNRMWLDRPIRWPAVRPSTARCAIIAAMRTSAIQTAMSSARAGARAVINAGAACG